MIGDQYEIAKLISWCRCEVNSILILCECENWEIQLNLLSSNIGRIGYKYTSLHCVQSIYTLVIVLKNRWLLIVLHMIDEKPPRIMSEITSFLLWKMSLVMCPFCAKVHIKIFNFKRHHRFMNLFMAMKMMDIWMIVSSVDKRLAWKIPELSEATTLVLYITSLIDGFIERWFVSYSTMMVFIEGIVAYH